jgi:hypothetical protein
MIIRDSSSASDRAAAIEAAFPDVATYEGLETRACALIHHGISLELYASFIDSVLPGVLASRGSVSLAGQAPALIGPESGSRFDFYPRKTTVAWHSVPTADHYLLEVELVMPVGERTSGGFIEKRRFWAPHGDGLHNALVRDTAATFFFVGAQEARWRVRATFADGRTTPPSEWWTFVYLQ